MNDRVSLNRKFPKVTDGDREYFGGDQNWSTKKYVKGYGCGVVACSNLLLHSVERKGEVLSREDYVRFGKRMRHLYLPVIPKFGMNGLFMALGMNVYFFVKRLPMRCYWGCLRKNIFEHIERMLREDFPPVLAIGPNFPNLWGKKTLTLYTLRGDNYVPAAYTKAHYVSVTAMDDEYLEVSSWGKKYYINRNEYLEYAKKCSNFLFTSILVVKKKKRK